MRNLFAMKSMFFLVSWAFVTSVYSQQIDRIAFGSCSFQFGKQKIWKSVVSKKPQLWIWLGDIIYGDTEDANVLRAKYAQLDSNLNYQLLKSEVPIIATWDDHDFGGNNAGAEYRMKKESKDIFLDFMKASEDDPRRTQEGIYSSYVYGEGDRKVKVILLDLRYNRQVPSDTTDMLGEAQWSWLEAELRNSEAKVNIIGSSIQFVAPVKQFENWAHFPKSQERMLNLIRDTGAKGVVFISGDVHYAETSKRKYDQVSYPIYDLTSSGLTHGNNVQGFKNPYRVGVSRFGFRNFGFIEFDWKREKLIYTEFDRLGVQAHRHDVEFSEIGW